MTIQIELDGFDLKRLMDGEEIESPVTRPLGTFDHTQDFIAIKLSPNAVSNYKSLKE